MRARRWLPVLAWLVSLASAGRWLLRAGGERLAGPPATDPAAWRAWIEAVPPGDAAFTVLRLFALVAVAYLLAVTLIGLLARASGRARWVRWADRAGAGITRRVLDGAVGLGFTAAALGVAGLPSAARLVPVPRAGAAEVETAAPVMRVGPALPPVATTPASPVSEPPSMHLLEQPSGPATSVRTTGDPPAMHLVEQPPEPAEPAAPADATSEPPAMHLVDEPPGPAGPAGAPATTAPPGLADTPVPTRPPPTMRATARTAPTEGMSVTGPTSSAAAPADDDQVPTVAPDATSALETGTDAGEGPTAETGPPPSTPPGTAEAPTWRVAAGDHLWSIAESVLVDHVGTASEAEVADYWQRLITLNRDVLVDPGNPDLIFVGQVFELPRI